MTTGNPRTPGEWMDFVSRVAEFVITLIVDLL